MDNLSEQSRVIEIITNGLMCGNSEIILVVKSIMHEENLKELVLANEFIVHRRLLENDDYYWVSDAENTFEIGIDLFCTINKYGVENNE